MVNHNNPILANGTMLDAYLSKGYYRMGKHIFTTDVVFNNNQYYKAFWLRYNLNKFHLSEKHQKLLKHLTQFTVKIKPFTVNQLYTSLYKKYYAAANFDASPSLESYLYSFDDFPQVQLFQFESKAIQIFREKLLVAAGIFDNGLESIAGIINFYNPEFKKYSLGKILVLLKLKYALEHHKKWYYPGYIVPGNPKFDYKTFVGIDCIEVYDTQLKEWVEYSVFFNK
jgi:leucyl-tRNA---protein transferase